MTHLAKTVIFIKMYGAQWIYMIQELWGLKEMTIIVYLILATH